MRRMYRIEVYGTPRPKPRPKRGKRGTPHQPRGGPWIRGSHGD